MAVISQINHTDLIGINRIDGEYFEPKYLALQKILDRLSPIPITSVTHVSDGNHMSISKFFTENLDAIPYYRGQDINDFFIENATPLRIPETVFNIGWLRRSHFKPGDVLLSIVGTVGSLSFVPAHFLKATGSCKIAILRPKGNVDGRFIAAFLASKYGQFQIKRNVRGAVQTGLILKDMGLIKIPLIDKALQDKISVLVENAIKQNTLSKSLYSQASILLDKELSLNKILFNNLNHYTTQVSEVLFERRMNAEYFSSQIKSILTHEFLITSKPLGTLYQIIRGFSPSNYLNEGIPVIKTKNIRIPEIDEERIEDHVKNPTGFVTIKTNDLLLASMGVGSLGRMSFIASLTRDFIVDGTIRILRKKQTTPDNYEVPTLLFLTSKVGQELIYRGIVGSTGIISLPDDYLYKIPIPKFSEGLCKQLSILVKKSMEAKKESKRLLEHAKTEVETIIELAAAAS
jgi:restriction endonuclease S subunit